MAGRWLPLGLIVTLLIFRIACLFQLQANSDEPQHLHIIYGWLDGALPYRDRFDNHTPFFHFIYLPLAAVFGETPNIVLIARLAILPFGLLAIGLIFELGRSLYDQETAMWALALLLALSDWSLKAIEFRPDVLWMCFWFGALLLLVQAYLKEKFTLWRFFFVGLLLGAALATSIKTVLFLPALAIGWSGAWLFSKNFREVHSIRLIMGAAGAGLAGLVIIPAIFLAWFSSKGALEAMRFCLFEVNREPSNLQRTWIFFLGLVPALFLTKRIANESLKNGVRSVIFLTTITSLLLILGLSPSLKKQTFLPVYPLLLLFAWSGWTVFCQQVRWSATLQKVGGCAVCLSLGAYMIWESQVWKNGLAAHRRLLTDVLRLTKPGEAILDLKGETIFRPRPIYLAFVLATGKAIADQRIPMEDVNKIAQHGTMVASGSGAGFPSQFRQFMKSNYIEIEESGLRVAGKELKPTRENNRWITRASIALPGEYVLIRNWRNKPSIASTVSFTSAGEHIIDMGDDNSRAILVWKRAVDLGYQPRKNL